MRIEDSACAVTGASSGIGEATGAAPGVARRSRRDDGLDRLRGLEVQLPGSVPLVTDVTDDVQLRAALARAGDVLGWIDVLVNDAGQGLHVPLEQLDPGDLRAVFDLNVVAPLVAMRAVLPGMRERGAGAVVNVSSLTSLRAFARLGGYCGHQGRAQRPVAGDARSSRLRGLRCRWSTRGSPPPSSTTTCVRATS